MRPDTDLKVTADEAPAATLTSALDQSKHVKTMVEQCAEELSSVNAALTHEVAKENIPPGVESALVKSEAVESKVQDASERLAIVNEALKGEVRVRHLLEDRVAVLAEQSEADRHASLHDPLTGLPNRALFNDRFEHGLAQARRYGWILAVMFLDLDNFKAINDRYGHDAGDTVLNTIAERLKTTTRRDDTISRHGGDEFLYLLAHISDEKDAVLIAQKLIQVIQEPCTLSVQTGPVSVAVNASIGISIFPRNGEAIDSLISHADAAMYEAKRSKTGYSVSR